MQLPRRIRKLDSQLQPLTRFISPNSPSRLSPCTFNCHAVKADEVASRAESDQLSRRAAVLAVANLSWAAVATHEASASPIGIDEVQRRLIKCFEEEQYYVSGKLDRDIFEPSCVFTDPTINVTGILGALYAREAHAFACI
jgi:hypothetical protein